LKLPTAFATVSVQTLLPPTVSADVRLRQREIDDRLLVA
jgi:hypothetical protein